MPTPTLPPEELDAEQVLKALGLEVRSVPTSASKTADFIVEGDARGYVLEVKARDDSEEWTRALRSGQVVHQERSMGYSPWAVRVAGDAVKQFRAVDTNHSKWWVLWLAIKCNASTDAMVHEAIGSLFGVRQLAYHDPHSVCDCFKDCLFARPGVFERHPEIVAGIVASASGFCLCVNDEFAEDFCSFRESVLWSSFGSPTTATDLTNNRGFLRADLSVNRRDDSALAASLERTYGLEKAIMLDMRVHSTGMLAKSMEG